MAAVEPNPPYTVYAHPLISWGSVILGAVAAVALGVLLNLLVAVFDASAALASLSSGAEAGENLLLVGVFGAVANLMALFAGGFIAARSANHPDHHDGMLHGLGVWAVSFVAALALLGAGVGTTMGGMGGMGVMGKGAAAASPAPPAAPPISVPPSAQRAAEADAEAEVRSEARDLAKAALETSFFAFAAMLVGLVAALLGGVAGARHPEHFRVRPRRPHIPL